MIRYIVVNEEEKHNYNKGLVWIREHQKINCDTKAEAIKEASYRRSMETGTDVRIMKSTHGEVSLIAHWRYVSSLDGTKSFWRRFV